LRVEELHPLKPANAFSAKCDPRCWTTRVRRRTGLGSYEEQTLLKPRKHESYIKAGSRFYTEIVKKWRAEADESENTYSIEIAE
jgi:hypothetical protein